MRVKFKFLSKFQYAALFYSKATDFTAGLTKASFSLMSLVTRGLFIYTGASHLVLEATVLETGQKGACGPTEFTTLEGFLKMLLQRKPCEGEFSFRL